MTADNSTNDLFNQIDKLKMSIDKIQQNIDLTKSKEIKKEIKKEIDEKIRKYNDFLNRLLTTS